MSSKTDNFEAVREILLRERGAEVSDLSHRLGVSEVTIRKLLGRLEDDGFLVRRYGGAVLAEHPNQVVEYFRKAVVNPGAKETVARLAAAMIGDDENVMLDAGSTNMALARRLRGRRLRVVTNSLAVAFELIGCEETAVEVVGGSLRKASGGMVGPRAVEELRGIRVDKVLIGCSGYDPERGFSSENVIEADTKRAMLACGRQRYVVCDSGKFDRAAFADFAAAGDVDGIITDRITPELEELRRRGVEVVSG